MSFLKRACWWLETTLVGAAHWRRVAERRAEEVAFWRESSAWWQEHAEGWQEVAETYQETVEARVAECLALCAQREEEKLDPGANAEAKLRVRAALEALDLGDGPRRVH